jgi:hypothetical protein
MAASKVISADSHIVKPPDMYTSRIEPKFRERARGSNAVRRQTAANMTLGFWTGRNSAHWAR